MQHTNRADVGNSSLISQEDPRSPVALRGIVSYLIPGTAAGLAVLEIGLSTSLEGSAPFRTLPPPASQPERSH